MESFFSNILESPTFIIIGFIGAVISMILGIKELVEKIKRKKFERKYKYLIKLFAGIKNKDKITIICSELEEADRLKYDPSKFPREFYYHHRFGDIDAYIETLATISTLFPKSELKLMSSEDAQSERSSGFKKNHLILVGGGDFNKTASQFLNSKNTQIGYREPLPEECGVSEDKEEIILYNKKKPSEKYWIDTQEWKDTKEQQGEWVDYGYFEKIVNPENPKKVAILIGGCHSLGVTSAIKAFSLYNQDETREQMEENSKYVVEELQRQQRLLPKDKNIFREIFNKSIPEFYIVLKGRGMKSRIETPKTGDFVKVQIKE